MRLKNKKHEKVAQKLALGLSQQSSYKSVYNCMDSTALVAGNQVANRPEVRDRVLEIIAKIPNASLDRVIKSVSDKLKAKKEVIYNSKGDSKMVVDNTARGLAEEKLLKIHGVSGFGHNTTINNDNRVQAINLKPDDIQALAHLVADMRSLNTERAEQELLQSGEVIDININTDITTNTDTELDIE